jgi:hypothetical protein
VHYGLIKWAALDGEVPEGVPNYWLKRIGPTLVFGSKHAILLQMALIPLTMCRFSIAALTESVLDRFLPLNRMIKIHIHLGYSTVGLVVFATLLFLVHDGTLCAGGEEYYCNRLMSEIMITGYGITGLILFVATTSYLISTHNPI